MATLSNSPAVQTIFRAEARKSFSIGIWLKDYLGLNLDITDCILRLVVRKKFVPSDPNDATAVLNKTAFLVDAGMGNARFDLQAADLDITPAEYEFAIVLNSSGYTSVIVEGIFEILQNTEFFSTNESFVPGINPPQALNVLLQEQVAVSVYAGQALAPGTTSFTNADKAHLDDLWTQGWLVLANKPDLFELPPGGSTGSALLKGSIVDGDVHWGQVATGGTGLDATGQPANRSPVSTGLGTWDWEEVVVPVTSVNGEVGAVVLTTGDVAEDPDKNYVSDDQLAQIIANDYGALDNLPALGSIASHDVADVHMAGDVIPENDIPKVIDLRGLSVGTAAPSGLAPGDFYAQI